MIPKYASNPVPTAHFWQFFTMPEVVGRFTPRFDGMWQIMMQKRARNRIAIHKINVQGQKNGKVTRAAAFGRLFRRTQAGPIRRISATTLRRLGFGNCRAPRYRPLVAVVR